jgi:hypothetical protein
MNRSHIRNGKTLLSLAGMLVLLLLVAACGSQPAAQDTSTGSETASGDTAGSDTMDSDAMDGDAMDGDAMDGDAMDGDAMDGDAMDMDDGHSMGNMSGGSNSAAYMLLRNTSDADDALVRASTAVADTVELHTVEMTDDGVMKMRPVPQIDIPAGGETSLQPGGFHVMLLGLKHDLKEGETVDLTLTFENAGDVTITAPVHMMEPEEPATQVEGPVAVQGAWVRAAVAVHTQSSDEPSGDESSMDTTMDTTMDEQE